MRTFTADAPKPPELHTRRHPDGSWFVAVTWQNGRQENVGRFQTAAEAEVHSQSHLQAWHDGFKQVVPKRKPFA